MLSPCEQQGPSLVLQLIALASLYQTWTDWVFEALDPSAYISREWGDSCIPTYKEQTTGTVN